MTPRGVGAALLVLTALAGATTAGAARASEQVADVNVRDLTLKVNAKGEALLTYVRADNEARHVLLWGAVDAGHPGAGPRQVRFARDYSGGWGKYHNARYWRAFRNACHAYTGPALPYLVTACTAPDGTHWAVQAWQRGLPLLGVDPWTPAQSAVEMHVSHWSGPLPELELYAHWTYDGRFQGVFGRLTYLGRPVHGLGATSTGNPRDRYGRNVYIDTLDSAYGAGWKRETGILLHAPGGSFCHSFVPQRPGAGYPSRAVRPAAPGARYRVTVMGPGVTPVVETEVAGLTAADRSSSAVVTRAWDRLMAGDARCAAER